MAGIQSIKTAVVAPVFNEAGTWLAIATELKVLFDLVVVVDDGSDIPLEHPNQEGLVLIRHETNKGKGAALQSGFQYCLDHGAQVIATVDTDGEHDPRNFIPALGRYSGEDLITLSRASFFGRYTWVRRLRNQIFSFCVSRRIGLRIADTQSGMRLFSAAAIKLCLGRTWPSGYAVETIMLETIADNGLHISEQPMLHPGAIRNGKKYSNIKVLLLDFQTFLSRLTNNSKGSAIRQSDPKPLISEDTLLPSERKA